MTRQPDADRAARGGGRLVAFYCTVLALVPFGIVAAGFAVARTPWFVAHAGSAFLANLGYSARLRGADCKILIYGDSSALAGLDPAIIRQRTGLSTCNIAEPAGVTAVNGTALVDSYLRRNPAPRVFVFDFASENLPPNWKSALTEGILVRVRERPDLSTLALLAAHPEDTLRFATGALRVAAQGIRKTPLPPETYGIRRSHRGYLPVPGRALTNCAIFGRQREGKVHAVDTGWIAGLRAKYGAKGSLVLVNVTPRAACDPDLAYFAGPGAAPTDNKLQAYPIAAFNGTGQLHMTRAGTMRFSTELGDQIAARLNRRAAPATTPGTH